MIETFKKLSAAKRAAIKTALYSCGAQYVYRTKAGTYEVDSYRENEAYIFCAVA